MYVQSVPIQGMEFTDIVSRSLRSQVYWPLIHWPLLYGTRGITF